MVDISFLSLSSATSPERRHEAEVSGWAIVAQYIRSTVYTSYYGIPGWSHISTPPLNSGDTRTWGPGEMALAGCRLIIDERDPR